MVTAAAGVEYGIPVFTVTTGATGVTSEEDVLTVTGMIVTGHTVVEMGYSDIEYLVVPFSVKVCVFVAMIVLVV